MNPPKTARNIGIALAAIALLAGCKPSITKRYAVVSMFNDVILETDDEREAFRVSHELTLLGRVLPSKPSYFVLEKR